MKRRNSQHEVRELRPAEVSIVGEVDYIVGRATAGESRIVTLGPLVLFSTATGDAWLLDGEDGLALCLARGGTRLPATITETSERFAVEWGGTFRIDGSAMTFADPQGGSRTILGYPSREIAEALRRARG